MKKRIISIGLAMTMIFSLWVTGVFALEPAEQEGTKGADCEICNHQHDGICGYSAAIEGQPCTHIHNENCGYTEGEEGSCIHQHDNICGYIQAVEAQPCNHVCIQGEEGEGNEDQNSNDVPSNEVDANQYKVDNVTEFSAAIDAIKTSGADDAVIIFTVDNLDVNKFAGIEEKHVTLKSTEGENYTLTDVGTSLVGDVTFDNVGFNISSLYANGFKFELTENSSAKINALYGGAYAQPVSSTKLILNGGYARDVYGGGKSQDVNGDVTIHAGGMFSSSCFVGGCLKGNVDGDVHIKLAGDSSTQKSFGSVYGGGSDSTSDKGQVSGNIYLDFESGIVGELHGGGSGNKDHVDTAGRVDGTICVTIGDMNKFGNDTAIQGACVTSVNAYGGGYLSSVGNVDITVENGAYLCDLDDEEQNKDLYAGSRSGIVRGTTKVTVNGGYAGTIWGAGETWVSDGQRSLIQNEADKPYATHITINNGRTRYVYPHGMHVSNGSVSEDMYEEINGSTLIEMNGGIAYQFVLSRIGSNLHGDSKLTVRGGGTEAVPSVYGSQNDNTDDVNAHVDGKVKVTFENCGSKDSLKGDQFLEWTQISDVDSVTLKNSKVSGVYLDFSKKVPFLNNVNYLNVTESSTLALDGLVSINKDFYIDDSTVALNRIDDQDFDAPIPAVITAGGKATGSGNLYTIGTENWLNDIADDNFIYPNRPEVGEIYVIAKKQGSTDPFTLMNDEKDLYVERIEDPASDDNYAWRIASGYVVTFNENGGATKADPQQCKIPVGNLNQTYYAALPTTNPTRTGYIFTGWNTEPDGTGTKFTEKTSVTESLTVYAQWKAMSSGEGGGAADLYDAVVNVKKVWAGDNEADRPHSVTVQLYRNGAAYGTPVLLSSTNNWQHTWSNLEKLTVWTVDEIDVPQEYSKSVTNEELNFMITNTKINGSTGEPDKPIKPEKPETPNNPSDMNKPQPDDEYDQEAPLASDRTGNHAGGSTVDASKGEVPKTGDQSQLYLWISLLAFSIIETVVIYHYRRRVR